jgi:hypothetical protein
LERYAVCMVVPRVSLRATVGQRLERLIELQRFAQELRRAEEEALNAG